VIEEISRFYRDAEEELAEIRAKAKLYLVDSPGKEEILQRIAVLEARLRRLEELDGEISKNLANHDTSSISGLRDLRKKTENTIRSMPTKIWQQLLFTCGEGKAGERCRTSWLPSDLVKEPAFAAKEAQTRKEIGAAKAALPGQIASLRNIAYLLDEAKSAPRLVAAETEADPQAVDV
jgi:DNA repair exonuclease SbcCD ATPase subunit